MRRPSAKQQHPNTWQYLRAAMGLFVLFYVGSTILLVFSAMLLNATGLDSASKWITDLHDYFWWRQPQWLFLFWCIGVILLLRLRQRRERTVQVEGTEIP